MPFNGSGTYAPLSAPNFPAVSGQAIVAAYYNNQVEDLGDALSNCITRDGQGKPSAPIDWNAQDLTNVDTLEAARVDVSASGTTMGTLYTSSVTTAEWYWGTAAIQGQLGINVASTYIYAGTKSNHDFVFKTNDTIRARITSGGVFQDANGFEYGFKTIPRDTTTVTAVVGMKGKCTALTAGMTIPSAAFVAGDSFSLYNDSAAAVTITQGGGLTLRFGGTTNTGNRTLGARGLVTVWFNGANEAIIQGSGLS